MMVMEVVKRNFLRLLRGGAFGYADEAVEPMSPWKWDMLYSISLIHGVAPLVNDGMAMHAKDFFMQTTPGQKAKWAKVTEETEKANRDSDEKLSRLFGIMNHGQLRPILMNGQSHAMLYDNPLHRNNGVTDIFFPYAPQAKKAEKWANDNGKKPSWTDRGTLKYDYDGLKVEHYTQAFKLTNFFLNRRLQNIINKEIRCCDSSYIHIGDTKTETMPPTLSLLLTMLRVARCTIMDGIRLDQLVDLGISIRRACNDIDFVKLQKWLDQLQMKRMAQMEGAMLVEFFRFDEDEIPFMSANGDKNVSKIDKDIFGYKARQSDDWYFTQGKNIFVRTSDSGAMTWQIKHLAKFFRYYPAETITAFGSTLIHSMSHIEE